MTLDDYHRLPFDSSDDAAAFVAALSRFVNGPAGQMYRNVDPPIEVWAEPTTGAPALTLYLSSAAVQATAAGFAQPPALERCRVDEFPPRRALIFGRDDRGAYGKDDIVRRLAAPAGERAW